MQKIKLLVLCFMIASVLIIGQPKATQAEGFNPPAITFTQDKNNPGLVLHNFSYDNGILIPGNIDIDNGFFVEVK